MSLEQYKDANRKELWEILQIQVEHIAVLENQWISVEDRLPEDGSLVVAAYHYEFTCEPDAAVCKFYNGNFQLNTDGLDAENHDGGAIITMNFKVTHWMPLPKHQRAGLMKMTEQQERAIQYIKNTGGNPAISWFDEDHEPIGAILREDLKSNGLIVEFNEKILITDKGDL